VQVTSRDDVGRRTNSGALYYARFDLSDGRALSCVPRAVMSTSEVDYHWVDWGCPYNGVSTTVLYCDVQYLGKCGIENYVLKFRQLI